MTLAADDAASHVDRVWDDDIVPVLHDYIRIPNVSVAFDAAWAEAGHMARATELLLAGASATRTSAARHRRGARDRGPHAPAARRRAAHGWWRPRRHRAALRPPRQAAALHRLAHGPRPVGAGGRRPRLYGRGSADDGYSTFSAITALEAVQPPARRTPAAWC